MTDVLARDDREASVQLFGLSIREKRDNGLENRTSICAATPYVDDGGRWRQPTAKDEFAEIAIERDQNALLVTREDHDVIVAQAGRNVGDVSYIVPRRT